MINGGVRGKIPSASEARESATFETFLKCSHHISRQVLTNLTWLWFGGLGPHANMGALHLDLSRGTTTKVALPHLDSRD